jgi:hypothetical protein
MTVTRYLLDTNTCIYIINRRPAKVFERLCRTAHRRNRDFQRYRRGAGLRCREERLAT